MKTDPDALLNTDYNRTSVLSNGRYRLEVARDGTGCAAFDGFALTRATAGRLTSPRGTFLYVRDLESDMMWSAAHEPVRRPARRYETWLDAGCFHVRRSDLDIDLHAVLCVAPDAELRRYTFANTSLEPRRLRVTSYTEAVVGRASADAAHPAFSNLFVQTERVSDGLLARRRPRSPDERFPLLLHALVTPDGARVDVESDRMAFIGRGRSLADPLALDSDKPLAGTTGSVLDPVLCLQTELRLAPGQIEELVLISAAAYSRREVAELVDRYRDAETRGEAFSDATLREPDDGEVKPVRRRRPSVPRRDPSPNMAPVDPAPTSLQMDNGFGGFSEDGREYVIRVRPDDEGRLRLPPMPWVNVIANERAGFIVSETGAGCTWQGNSRENRLTPWYNDPVLDPFGEALFLRDEASGITWSPTPGPAVSGAPIDVRHGLGYSEFRQSCHGLRQHVTMFVPVAAPLKVVRLDLTNTGSVARRLRVGAFARWVLGPSEASSRRVVTDRDERTGAITALNPDNDLYGDAVAFALLTGEGGTFTTSCEEFLGDGDLTDPDGMRSDLSGRTGSDLDPCVAFNEVGSIAAGATTHAFFLLGQVDDPNVILDYVRRFGTPDGAAAALQAVKEYWSDVTTRLQVDTPLPEVDLLVNAWLPYQTLSCRLRGRSAFYQSGGAFGYRDQLQDASAFAATMPGLVRDQILLHADHQFVEGDVMHWWHPPRSRGMRTRFSDDLLWLPFVTLDYLETTGDRTLLEENVGYLEGPDLPDGEDEVFIEPTRSAVTESVYLHCCRAVDRSLTRGANGLPLIGSGDWNDGMNRVGREGRGESVWLGFFLLDVLRRFIPLCDERDDMERATRYKAFADDLADALNDAGWDGAWYRRAFYDNGDVLGSARSDECQIDALVQAWSVLSGTAPPDRARQALDAMEQRLVSESDGIIRLLTPPFDRTENDPGYIKGYVPGVRENGGQYTHAALWAVRALAMAGRSERAAPLLAMLSPVTHARTRAAANVYKVEPFVVAADVYGAPPHVGRGGWTWYTGSAAWMHRVAVESIVGFRVLDGSCIEINPCVPGDWEAFSVHYRLPSGNTTYDIAVRGEPAAGRRSVRSVTVDGTPKEPVDGRARFPLVDDGRRHQIEIRIGS